MIPRNPKAEDVLKALDEPAAHGGNPPFWNEAMTAMPEGPLPFLAPETLAARREQNGLPAARDPLLREMAATVAADPPLLALAWYLHWRVFVIPGRGVSWGAPPLTGRLGSRAGMFYELLALEFAPRLAARHREWGYPASVTAQTVKQVAAYESNHLRGRGEPGIYENQFPWFATYLAMPHVRLGRLEFQLCSYEGGVSVWRRAADGQVLALAEDGARVMDDGLLAGAADTGFWTATRREDEQTVEGFPVDPAGRILRQRVVLRRPEWTPVFSKGTTVLNLHIPAGGGMTWESVCDSFRQAQPFFTRHHPDRPFAALVVGTWFMDPRLADILPASANPLRMQRACYLFPIPPGPGGLWFVFLRDTVACDPATLPRDTSLRRALADFLASGKRWHGGGMFVLPEDLANPREGCYTEQFAALRAAGLPGPAV